VYHLETQVPIRDRCYEKIKAYDSKPRVQVNFLHGRFETNWGKESTVCSANEKTHKPDSLREVFRLANKKATRIRCG